MNITVLNYDTIDSTNTEALKQARQGAAEGLCIVARQQTAGRGRHGRRWVSEKDAGLYFSIVLRPRIDPKYLPLITLMSGIAVHDLLASYRLEPDIKWVNDILVNEKKISGILAETTDTPVGLAVVVGVGINLAPQSISNHLVTSATSLQAELSDTEGISTIDIANSLASFIQYWYDRLMLAEGPESIIRHWQWRSSYFSGKSVRISMTDETIEGITDGLESNGALRVIKNDGSLSIVQAGDVQTLRTNPAIDNFS